MSAYNLKQDIYKILVATYDHKASPHWYHHNSSDSCKGITADILAVVAYSYVNPKDHWDEYHVFHEIRNILWNMWTGGTTAANIAAKIAPLFNAAVPDLSMY